MERKLRVAMYGCGKMSEYLMRYVYEKGGEIVCAFDVDKSKLGKDIGTIINDGKNYNISIDDAKNAKEVFAKTSPDICIVATMSLLNDLKEALLVCAECGVNAITTCEEAFYPWNSNPMLTSEIDALAKETGCTICGSGYQDVLWGNLITTLAGATQTIKKIKGRTSYNVEDYGIALARAHGAGLTLKEFDEQVAAADNIPEKQRQKLIENGEYTPSYMWNTNGWLCSQLGLTVTKQTQKCVPEVYEKDLYSETLNMTIKAGDARGMSAVVTTETEEGIILETQCVGMVYAPDEFDSNVWTLEGEPDTTITVERPKTVELTCATIVNRLLDVLEAEPGYVTTEKMPRAQYVQGFSVVEIDPSELYGGCGCGCDCGCDDSCDCGCDCDGDCDETCDCGCHSEHHCTCGCCDCEDKE